MTRKSQFHASPLILAIGLIITMLMVLYLVLGQTNIVQDLRSSAAETKGCGGVKKINMIKRCTTNKRGVDSKWSAVGVTCKNGYTKLIRGKESCTLYKILKAKAYQACSKICPTPTTSKQIE